LGDADLGGQYCADNFLCDVAGDVEGLG